MTEHRLQHEHTFGQDRVRPGERRTVFVIAITASMMVAELVAGTLFGSMALLADGIHMASHAAALSISAFAYWFARKRARDRAFSFGTGKVNALGGFAGAVLLGGFALIMAGESVHRFFVPISIAFDWAIRVAVVGLIVNGASVLILDAGPRSTHATHDHHRHDHNLRSAYLHVLADALTSVLAILALLAGKYLGLHWMDPLMGLVGAVLVARWSVALMRQTAGVLLDAQAPASITQPIREAIEGPADAELTDLHVWSIGPGIYAAALTVAAASPRPPREYRALIPDHLGVVHASIEVHQVGASPD